MTGESGPSGPNRWNSATLGLLRWVDPSRGAELRAHIEDAAEAGEPLGPGDAVTVLGLAIRTQSVRLLEQLRLTMIGLPVALLCVMVYGAIYESHFAPWDLMEEFTTTDPQVAFIRHLVELAWLLLVPLGLATGWQVVRSVQGGRFILPGIFVLALVVLFLQSNIFIERTEWFAEGLQAKHVDSVSPYSLGLFSLVFLLPLAYLALEGLARLWRHSKPSAVQFSEARAAQAIAGQAPVDLVAFAAVLAPLLMLVVPLIPLVLFLVLVFVAPTFERRHKVAAASVVLAPVIVVATIWSRGGIDDPGLGALALLVAFVAVWIWLTVVALVRNVRQPGPACQDAGNESTTGLSFRSIERS